MNPEVHLQVQALLRRVVADPSLEVGAATRAADVEGWTSLAHIQLMVGIEQHYGIRFGLAEVNAPADVGELVTLVARKAGLPAG